MILLLAGTAMLGHSLSEAMSSKLSYLGVAVFLVSKIAMPHLIAALKAEIEQEKDTATWTDGDDGPEG